MFASSIFRKLTRAAIAAAALLAGGAALPDGAQARDRFGFSLGFSNYGASSIGFGYSSGGPWGRGWGHRGWGHRGWGRDHFSLGFTYVVPPAYYGPRPYDYPAYYGAAPYGYPTRSYYRPGFYPVGGVVAFSAPVRDRLGSRTRGVYYDAYMSALDAPVGESINWRDGRISGDVTTTRDGWAGERYCREFRQNIIIDGKTEEAYGTACRNEADTDWEIIPN
ncbi:MAG: hypothetical protein AB7E79_11735 [Rhodospirillaceae bacterium]